MHALPVKSLGVLDDDHFAGPKICGEAAPETFPLDIPHGRCHDFTAFRLRGFMDGADSGSGWCTVSSGGRGAAAFLLNSAAVTYVIAARRMKFSRGVQASWHTSLRRAKSSG